MVLIKHNSLKSDIFFLIIYLFRFFVFQGPGPRSGPRILVQVLEVAVVHCTFYKSTIKSNCKLLLCHVHGRSSRQEVFRNFAEICNFIKETLTQLFCCNFCEIFKNTFSYRTPLVAASGVSEWIYGFRTSCSKQAQCLKFKW